jgi:disulfide bond formation protein DsbB
MNKKTTLIFLARASIFGLTFAYISQYFFGHEPCILCLYQRKPFFAIIAATLLCFAFFKSEKSQKITFFLCIALLAINCAIAFYHIGVEQKIFAGPTTCSSDNLNEITDLAALEAALAKTKAVRCDQPTFFLPGFSMAVWNFIFCLGLIILSAKSPLLTQAWQEFCKRRSSNLLTKR